MCPWGGFFSLIPQAVVAYCTSLTHECRTKVSSDFLALAGELPYTLNNFEKLDKLVSELNTMALAEETISYGEKLPLVSGSWDLSTGFWWNDLKNFMREKRNITDWRVTFEDDSLRLHLSGTILFRAVATLGSISPPFLKKCLIQSAMALFSDCESRVSRHWRETRCNDPQTISTAKRVRRT